MNEIHAQVQEYRDFGEALIHRGILSRDSLERAWRVHEERDEGLCRILSSLGLVSDEALVDLLVEVSGLPRADRDELLEPAETESEFPRQFLKENRFFPYWEDEDRLMLAVADPFNRFAISLMEMKCGKSVDLAVAAGAHIDEAIERLFEAEARTIGDADKEEPFRSAGLAEDITRLEDLASEAPVIRFVNRILRRAVDIRASDIHLEAREAGLIVRYRVDGVLRDDVSADVPAAAVISRLKILAQLDIAENRLPQDGRVRLPVKGRDIDFRVSTLPVMHGESGVLRVLDKSVGVLGIDQLGFDPFNRERFENLLRAPNGIILVTGPTGSGKTTTLYAAIRSLNARERKIITVEDPIEYQLEGINQIQIKPQVDLTFARTLRSVLRHDPDIILIGEIRDPETARIAVQASLTGHLVLSTLHTNSAAAAVNRFLDMGVEDYLLASTVNGVVAQRLLRKLCPHCKISIDEPELIRKWKSVLGTIEDEPRFYRAVGCGQCGESGYFGRTCVAEVMPLDETLKDAALEKHLAEDLERIARKTGFRSMFETGVSLAAGGETSMDEVLRVLSGDQS